MKLKKSDISIIRNTFYNRVKKTFYEDYFFKRSFKLRGIICSIPKKHPSGYNFKLKDTSNDVINIFIPKDNEVESTLREGNEVEITGKLNLYYDSFKNGFDFLQMIASEVYDKGMGENKREKILEKITNKGYTSRFNKKKLKFSLLKKFNIMLITSANSEAVADIESILSAGSNKFTINKSFVNLYDMYQISDTIKSTNRKNYDAVIIARGGVERVDIFDEEPILNDIYRCRNLVITAIGHANQKPLADRVADISEATPSACAKLLLYKREEHIRNLKIKAGLIGIVIFIIVMFILLK